MDMLEQPDVKKTYDKCKYIVKLWEHNFTKKHKRLPSKLDIREANRDVRHAYRKYFQLKTAALEQSFMDVDGFNSDEENTSNIASDNNTESTLNCSVVESVEKIDELPTEHLKEIDNSIIKTSVQNDTWGTHLNIKTCNSIEAPVGKTDTKPNLNLSITKKLFCGSKFAKRNPRKSLSFSQKKSSETSIDEPTFLSQPASSFPTFKSEEAITDISENLIRNDGFKIVTLPDKVHSQPVNIFQSVLQNGYKSLKSVDNGWLERVAQKTGTTIENPDLPLPAVAEIFPKPTTSSFSSYTTNVTKVDYDSDDIIDNSDEDMPFSQSTVLHVAKKNRTELSDVSATGNKQEPQSSNHLSPIKLKQANENTIVTLEQNVEVPSVDEEQPVDAYEFDEVVEKKTLKPRSKPRKKIQGKRKTNVEEIKTSVTVRRSNRQNKLNVNLQEYASDEEDPFHSDNDEKDPAFTLVAEKANYEFFDSQEESVPLLKKKVTKSKVNPKINLSKKGKSSKKKEDLEEKTEENNENDTPYELEYCVKPRIVAPRFSNLKKVLTDRKTVTTGVEKSSAESTKNESEFTGYYDKVKDKVAQAKESLEKKISSGNLNENFVRINLKKKVFARGKSGISFSKYKKSQWKMKKKSLCGPDMDMGGCDGGMLTCFNCGQVGHFARKCTVSKGDGLLPLTAAEVENCPYPTLKEASQMAQDSVLHRRVGKLQADKNKIDENCEEQDGEEIDAEGDDDSNDELDDFDDLESEQLLLETMKLEEHVKKLDVKMYVDTVKVVNPYFELNADNNIVATPNEVFAALNMFGHSTFRAGQEQAVMRILSGQSTLVTLSTGSGKSLCYQLPAYLYSKREPCISLVISPLVSLMEDQVTGIPSFLKAACLHTNQTKPQRDKIMEAISMGNLSVLLISPEAVVAGEKQTGFGSLLRKLPPIAFACIDEAHCVSQWSHNFRPSYLMICRVLRESLGVKTILGLTATATRATSDSIIEHLQIPDGRTGIISDIPLPDNLILTVSKDAQKDRALLGLLLSERFSNCKSIIVYCTRRDECERIASFLRTSLKSETVEVNVKKRKRLNVEAEPYHAGLSASRRRTIQNSFMSGHLRIVVATVAFGMGINKSDIRAVIHYNMPKTFESYVQEVGRAGRDGLPAHCHVFLNSQGKDENELRRHIHANSIDRHVIRKLLQKIFIPCSCATVCPKHEVAFSIEETVQALDIPEENISTLLCYLELHENKYIQLLSPAYTSCKVISYGGPFQIRKASKECPPLAMALALHRNKQGEDPNVLEFPVVDVAAAMGWDSGICKHKLKNLEWISEDGRPKRSALTVRLYNLGFRLFAPGNLSDDKLDEALDSLYNRVVNQEQTALLQLHAVHETLVEVAAPIYNACISVDGDGTNKLKTKVREYFESPNPLKSISELEPRKINEEQLVNDIKTVIFMYKDNTFTGRAIARIFHGIPSPNYPAVIWGRCKFWRSHMDDDFHTICKIATREILKLR